MKTRQVGIISLICLVLTLLWLVFFIAGRAAAGPLASFDQVLANVTSTSVLFYLTYTNAALFTVGTVMLFAALYRYCEPMAPDWSAIGLAFVPIYGAMNLAVYVSQITIVPRLLHLQAVAEHQVQAQFLLRQTLQQWPDSAAFLVNNLAYAVLGVPSIIFGVLMASSTPPLRVAGALVALNGIACIAGLIGLALESAWLGQGSFVGGVLFLLALVCLSWVFLQRRPEP